MFAPAISTADEIVEFAKGIFADVTVDGITTVLTLLLPAKIKLPRAVTLCPSIISGIDK